MTRRQGIALAAIALVGVAALAIASLPATRALAWAGPPDMQTSGVSGSAWSGRAQRVAFGGPAPIEDLRWDVAAWRLVLGQLAADAEFRVAGLAVDGRFATAAGGQLSVSDATIAGPAAAVPWLAGTPFVALGGSIDARVDRAALEARRPRYLRGHFQWRRAEVLAPVRLDLGTVRGRIAPDERGGHTLALEARGGEVALAGELELAGGRRYRVDLLLTPAPQAPQRVHDILGMIGRAQDGRYVIRRSGQLPP